MKKRDPFATATKNAATALKDTAKFLRLEPGGMWCTHAYNRLGHAARAIGRSEALATTWEAGSAVRDLDKRYSAVALKLHQRCFIKPFRAEHGLRGRRR